MDKLLPCPFCGHLTPYFERRGSRRQSCIVACGSCGCRHESSDEGRQSGSSWNERAASPSPSTTGNGGVDATFDLGACSAAFEASDCYFRGESPGDRAADWRVFLAGYKAATAPAPSLGIDAPQPPQETAASFDAIMLAATRWKRRDLDRAGMEAAIRTSLLGRHAPEQQPVECNCPGRLKPWASHAPNCPVHMSKATLVDPYDGGTWAAATPAVQPPVALPIPHMVTRTSDMTVMVSLRSTRQASEFEAAMRAHLLTHPAAQQGDGNAD